MLQSLIALLTSLSLYVIDNSYLENINEVCFSTQETFNEDNEKYNGKYQFQEKKITIYDFSIYTFLHEIGHHVCYQFDSKIWGTGKSIDDYYSYYAQKNEKEDCAETFKAYILGNCSKEIRHFKSYIYSSKCFEMQRSLNIIKNNAKRK